MILKLPTDEFISEILEKYSKEEGDELNEKLLQLFKVFNDDSNKYNVLIKVAALNKIYSTAITNINPVVDQIIKISKERRNLKELNDFVKFVDEISIVNWKNKEKNIDFTRNNLSFASKYVHFLSEFKTPIYDSYIWILINGYLGIKNGGKFSFSPPKNFEAFYLRFKEFKTEFKLEKYLNYSIDKFLWQYGKQNIQDIMKDTSLNLDQAKSELKNRIKKYN